MSSVNFVSDPTQCFETDRLLLTLFSVPFSPVPFQNRPVHNGPLTTDHSKQTMFITDHVHNRPRSQQPRSQQTTFIMGLLWMQDAMNRSLLHGHLF